MAVNGGTFTMNGGNITGCTAMRGGGVYVASTGTFAMNGGSILYNNETAADGGGGVNVASGTFSLSGAPRITGNTAYGGKAGNVFLNTNMSITVTGALSNATPIGVTTAATTDGTVVATGSSYITSDTAAKFKSDVAGKYFEYDATAHQLLLSASLPVGTWAQLAAAVAGDGTTNAETLLIKLTANVTATDGSSPLTVGTGKTVTLDLNGKTISGSGTVTGTNTQVANMTVFVSGGSLTVTDSGSGGRIVGYTGDGTNAGVCVNSGSFTLSGGKIDGSQNGTSVAVGVFVEGGAFIMSGGEISGNRRSSSGVGVSLAGGTFTMTGGTIQNNQTTGGSSSGAGVYVYSGTFTMSGGEISGNKANAAGAGVLVASGGTFNLSGSPVISGNTWLNSSTTPSNVSLASGKTITVTGALTNSTPIGVSLASGFAEGAAVVTGGTPAGGSTAYQLSSGDAAKFTAEATGQYFDYDSNAHTLTFTTTDPSLIDTYAELKEALLAGGAVTLATDITSEQGSILLNNVTATLNLNGHKFTAVDHTVRIQSGATLTIAGPGTMTIITNSNSASSTLLVVDEGGTLILMDGTSEFGVTNGPHLLGAHLVEGSGYSYPFDYSMSAVCVNTGGTLRVSGNPVIKGNQIGGSDENGRGNVLLGSNAVITIDSTLGAQAWIGVNLLGTVTADTPAVITSGYGGVLENDKFHVGYTSSTASYAISACATANGMELAVFHSEDDFPYACGRCGTNSSVYWTISNTYDMQFLGSGAIPDYDAKAAPWFKYRHRISTVSFDAGITRVGNHAFYACGALEEVTGVNNAMSVGSRAFAYCVALESVHDQAGENASFASIGEGAFYACYNLPAKPANASTAVGDKAFELCLSLPAGG